MGKFSKNQTEGELLYHTSCIGDNCNSSDAMAVYAKPHEDKETTIDAYCWSCHSYFHQSKLEEHGVKMQEPEQKYTDKEPVDFSSIESLDCRGWKDRGITSIVSAKYGVRTEIENKYDVVSRHYPITADGKIVGYKKRTTPKTFIGIGNTKATNEFFGQSAFPSSNKYLVVTTGEEDAMSFAEVLRSGKDSTEYWTPCVSVTAGDGSIIKQFKANYEYLCSHEKIILAFDNDEPGQRYMEEAARH